MDRSSLASWGVTAAVLLLAAAPAAAQEGEEAVAPAQAMDSAAAEPSTAPAPLFASNDMLTVTIEGPISQVIRERDDDQESFDGTVRYVADDGSEVTVPAKLRTRGAFRLQRRTCGFPPLRINVDRDSTAGTLFEGLNKIKLVTHCDDKREEYEQNAVLEYLLYRIYNLFTETSFRVRPAQIMYADTEAKRDTITKFGFFIEPIEAVAARNGYDVLELPQVPPGQMQQDDLMRYEIFQYMIGNSDWDPFKPKQGEEYCCHNGELIGSLRDIIVIPVPYDFDWSGVVDARYAKPNPILGIRNVRQRRFWGICRPEEAWIAALPQFRERQEAVYDLFRLQPNLDEKRREKTLEYLDEFYELIADEDDAGGRFRRECRG